MNSIQCVTDADCCPSCTCEVTNSKKHISRCFAHDFHLANQGEMLDNEQDDNAERGEFENGYWCLKDSDCATKHCAQVGPRRYDKECQDVDFVDFVPDLKPKKRGPHKRDPLPED